MESPTMIGGTEKARAIRYLFQNGEAAKTRSWKRAPPKGRLAKIAKEKTVNGVNFLCRTLSGEAQAAQRLLMNRQNAPGK